MQVVESALEDLRSEIESAYHQQNEFAKKTVECIVRIGELLLEADAYFEDRNDPMALLEFEESLPFTKSMGSKYRHIVKNATLADPTFNQQLPPSIHSLYELSHVEPAELRKGIETGAISAEFERSDVAEYTAQHRAPPAVGVNGRPLKADKPLYDAFSL